MKKLNWQTHLFGFLEAQKDQSKFSYGICDCFTFASEAIRLQTGISIAGPYLDKYKTEKQALKLMKKLGLDEFTDLVAEHFSEIKPTLAQRGDIVAFDHPGPFKVALAVCVGQYAVGLHPEKGLYPVEMKDWIHAWRIVA
ncbi:MAG: hypothetical protein OQJ95_10045 [Kangiella sp.]|nr:hypothetical protein [Kangiella sp.]MCW9029662.1 hypothetical protein [Kangiella sp.]